MLKKERNDLKSLEMKEIDLLFALVLNPSLDLPCFTDFRIILRAVGPSPLADVLLVLDGPCKTRDPDG